MGFDLCIFLRIGGILFRNRIYYNIATSGALPTVCREQFEGLREDRDRAPGADKQRFQQSGAARNSLIQIHHELQL